MSQTRPGEQTYLDVIPKKFEKQSTSNMNITKQQFMKKPKIRNLPAAEKERRWDQHRMSIYGEHENRATVKGKGNYFKKALRAIDDGILKQLKPGTFADGGAALGSMFGMGDLGRGAGSLLAQITGRGNYNVQQNSIMQGDNLKPTQLSFSSHGAAAVRLQKREYIAAVTATENPEEFFQLKFRLQATDAGTFPWLSDIAGHFTEWQMLGAVFSFETSSSNYSQSMALGTFAIGTQYNANERDFQNLEEILQSPFHTRGNPSESLMHGIECDPQLQSSEKLFTRRPGTQGPPNLYDHGVTTFATEGLPAACANQIIGRIYVTYDIELSLPVLPTSIGEAGSSCVIGVRAAAPSTTGPPLGLFASCVSSGGNLSYGAGFEDNILQLQPSAGPQPDPTVAGTFYVDVKAWCSDSSTALGTQYVSFKYAGKYSLTLIFTSNAGVPVTASAVTCTPYNNAHSNVTTFYQDNLMAAGGGQQAGWGVTQTFMIETLVDGGAVQLTRQNAENFMAQGLLVLCT